MTNFFFKFKKNYLGLLLTIAWIFEDFFQKPWLCHAQPGKLWPNDT